MAGHSAGPGQGVTMLLSDYMAKLDGMIAAAGLPRRGSYRPGEVCLLFGIDGRLFRRLCDEYEEDERGRQINRRGLDSFYVGGHRRVRYDALVTFFALNHTYDVVNDVNDIDEIRKVRNEKKDNAAGSGGGFGRLFD